MVIDRVLIMVHMLMRPGSGWGRGKVPLRVHSEHNDWALGRALWHATGTHAGANGAAPIDY